MELPEILEKLEKVEPKAWKLNVEDKSRLDMRRYLGHLSTKIVGLKVILTRETAQALDYIGHVATHHPEGPHTSYEMKVLKNRKVIGKWKVEASEYATAIEKIYQDFISYQKNL